MQLDELRIVVLNERESGRLSDISPDVFTKAEKYLKGLREEACREARSPDRFLTDRARDVLEEMNSINETLQDIVRLRSRKILMLALVQTESTYVDRGEIRKMLPSEKAMLEAITGALSTCRRSMLATGAEAVCEPPAIPEAGEEPEEPECASPLPPAADAEEAAPSPFDEDDGEKCVLVRVLGEIEPFMGVDGKIYTLGREDIAVLPKKNAEVLCERNIALNIRVSK
jgi:DNA replication factor GINS